MIDEDEVRKMYVNMLVYSGAYNLCINEVIQKQLQFPIVEKRKTQLANGSIEVYDVVDNVQVRFNPNKSLKNQLQAKIPSKSSLYIAFGSSI